MSAAPTPGRLRRLIEELGEVGLDLGGSEPWHDLAVEELDYALRPKIHERRVPSVGAFIDPTIGADLWEEPTGLGSSAGRSASSTSCPPGGTPTASRAG